MKRFLFILFFLINGICAFAQNIDFDYLDYVYLKGGKVVEGKILYRNIEGDIKLQMEDDTIVSFKSDQIKKVIQSEKFTRLRPKEDITSIENHISRKKVYYRFSFILSRGVGIEQVLGYQYNTNISFGAGIGLEKLFLNLGKENLMTIFGEFRGATKARKITPTYSLIGGYGFAFEKGSDIEDKGGFLLNPSFGIKFRGAAKMKCILDIGIRIQSRTAKDPRWSNVAEDIPFTTLISRFGSMKLGILF